MPAETGLSPTEATGFRKAAELRHAAAQMMLGLYLMAGVTGEPCPIRIAWGWNAPSRRA